MRRTIFYKQAFSPTYVANCPSLGNAQECPTANPWCDARIQEIEKEYKESDPGYVEAIKWLSAKHRCFVDDAGNERTTPPQGCEAEWRALSVHPNELVRQRVFLDFTSEAAIQAIRDYKGANASQAIQTASIAQTQTNTTHPIQWALLFVGSVWMGSLLFERIHR